MNVMSLTIFVALGAVGQTTTNFYHDFRKKTFSEEHFQFVGSDAPNRIRPEEEGLRITLPAQQGLTEPVGITTRFDIKGDVEITVGYEILEADTPKGGWGVSFEVYLELDNPPKYDGLGFNHIIRPNGNNMYRAGQRRQNKQGKREYVYRPEDKPAAGMSGQLRITRVGTNAVLSAADQAGKKFTSLFQCDVGSEDFRVRLAAHPGGTPNPVDLRILDLRVRDVDPNSVDLRMPEYVPPPSGRNSLWLVLALLAALVMILCFWLWLRKKRANEHEATPPADSAHVERP